MAPHCRAVASLPALRLRALLLHRRNAVSPMLAFPMPHNGNEGETSGKSEILKLTPLRLARGRRARVTRCLHDWGTQTLARRDAATLQGKAVSYARRFKTNATMTARARIPTTHGHTGDLCSAGKASLHGGGCGLRRGCGRYARNGRCGFRQRRSSRYRITSADAAFTH